MGDTNKPSPFGTTASQPSAFDLQQLSHLITNLHHSVKLTHQIHLLFQIQLQPPRQPTLHLHLDHLTIILQTLWWPIFNKLAIWANTNIFFYIWCQQSNPICIWNGINSKYKSGFGSNNSASTIANTNQNSSTTNNANPFGSTSEAIPTFSFISTQPKSQPQTQTTRSIDVDIQENTQMTPCLL